MINQLDDSILEALAETICGGGNNYDAPGPYRSMTQIEAFFERADVTPAGISGTRKWFALECLQDINGTRELEWIILRLGSPLEYRGDTSAMVAVINHVNSFLQMEGLELAINGVTPFLRQREPTITIANTSDPIHEPAPDFYRLVADSNLAGILENRWQEAQKCVNAEAFLAAIVMMGSILEGVLLHKVESHPEQANRAQSSPKSRQTGRPQPFKEWGLSALIDVSRELGWLQGDITRYSHALRESRNIVHPYSEREQRERPDQGTCNISWQVVREAVADLSQI